MEKELFYISKVESEFPGVDIVSFKDDERIIVISDDCIGYYKNYSDFCEGIMIVSIDRS
jgi:hypothetical protein